MLGLADEESDQLPAIIGTVATTYLDRRCVAS